MNKALLTPTPLKPLSQRLGHLYQRAKAKRYDHIWDLCCDHGRLGLHLDANHNCNRSEPSTGIHLIDRVPSIINALRAYCRSETYAHIDIQCRDAGALVLSPEQQAQKHIFIIAGIGGETAAKIADGILANNAGLLAQMLTPAEFLFSPNNQAFELRRFLQQPWIQLLDETFVSENGWHHEHIHVQLCAPEHQQAPVSAIGESLWEPMTPQKRHYLSKQQNHYARCAKYRGGANEQLAAEGYQHRLLSSNSGDFA